VFPVEPGLTTTLAESRQQNWTTENETEIVLSRRWLREPAGIIEPIVCFENFVPEIVESRPVKPVCSGARDYLHLRARSAAEFRCIARSLNLEFLQSVNRYQIVCAAGR